MWHNRNDAIYNVELRLTQQVGKQAARVEGYFSTAAQIPNVLSSILSIDQTQNEEDFDAFIREILKTSPHFIGSCIAFEPNEFREGIERFAPYVHRKVSGDEELFSVDLAKTYKKDYMTWDWYRIPKETGRGTWSEPYFDEGGGNVLMCTYSAPFFRNGRFTGVVTVDVGLDELQAVMFQIASEGTRYYLLNSSGTFIAAPEPELIMKETIFSIAEKYNNKLTEIGHAMLRGGNGVLPYTRIVNNQRVWLAYAPIASWSLMATIPESQILGPVYDRVYYSIFHLFIEFAIILIVIVIVSWQLTAPIKRLATFARKIATGDLGVHVGHVRFASEIDQLAHAFDKMVVDLKSNIEQRIKEETARQTVEEELKAARKIQASLLPRIFPPFPELSEFDLYAMNEPATFIAGDFFDFFFIKPNTLAFVLADVSGHGGPAALFMAVSRTVIRTFAVPERSPHEIINQVNRMLNADNDDMMFVTLFYGHYDIGTGELIYVNAGHELPYIVRKNGHLETLMTTGPMVAAFGDISYEEQTVSLEPGDILVTFTDGVTEAHSSRDNILYGKKRLEQFLHELRGESVEEICNRIYSEVDHFAGHEQQDDITLLVLRRNEI